MNGKKIRRLVMAAAMATVLWTGLAMPVYAAQYVEVTAPSVHVRSNAGSSYAKLGTTFKGKTYRYLGSKKAANGRVWYKIQFTSKKTGWITSGYTKLRDTSKDNPTTTKSAATTTQKDTTTTAKTTNSTISQTSADTQTETSATKPTSADTQTETSATKPTSADTQTSKTEQTSTTTQTRTSSTQSRTLSTTSTTVKPQTTTTTQKKSSAIKKQVKITAASVNVRSNAGASYTKVGRTSKGKTYDYLGSKKASNGRVWYKIQFTSKKTGWVTSGYCTLITVQLPSATSNPDTGKNNSSSQKSGTPSYIRRTITVSKKSVKVYSAPGSYNKQMGTVKKGARYVATGWKNDRSDTTWYSFKLNGKEVWISRFNVTVSDSYTSIPEKSFQNGGVPMIYLSPSKQIHNAYAVGSTTEQVQMYRVANALKRILEKEYVCTVYIAPTTLDLTPDGRAYDAYQRGADVYLAIHSNADQKVNRSHYGPMGFYFPGSTQSKRLARNIVNEMTRIAPKQSTVSPNLVNGMMAFDKTGYTDVRDPSNYGIASVLAEVEFHDKADSARWIINHPNEIARALANALEHTFDMQKK